MNSAFGTLSSTEIFLVLYNIRSAENVGSLFRTADAAGVTKVCLVGYTPHPIDRFGRINPKITKAALGATETVPYVAYETIESCVRDLHSKGVQVVSIEQHPHAQLYSSTTYADRVAFILGNEIEGVPSEVCEMSDTVVAIPMMGIKESLNVGVAGGVVLFDALRKRTSTR